MITNTIIPVPIITHSSGGGVSISAIISIGIALFILGIAIYLIGYINKGIKNNDWSFDIDDSVLMIFGGVTVFLCVAFFIFNRLVCWLVPIVENLIK